jgi:nitrogen fixation-related uncharacterized protein
VVLVGMVVILIRNRIAMITMILMVFLWMNCAAGEFKDLLGDEM